MEPYWCQLCAKKTPVQKLARTLKNAFAVETVHRVWPLKRAAAVSTHKHNEPNDARCANNLFFYQLVVDRHHAAGMPCEHASEGIRTPAGNRIDF